MKSILFLDDCPTRRGWAAEHIHGAYVERHDVRVTLVANAADAIKALAGPPYDLVYLDHDLEGEPFADPSGRNTGSEVVRRIVANKPAIGKVIVHSLNGGAAGRMVDALRRHGYDAEATSFLTLVNDAERKAASA